MSKRFAILLAAGEGRRMGRIRKQYLGKEGFPLFYFSLQNLLNLKKLARGVVVVKKGDQKKVEQALARWGVARMAVIEGGTTRQKSMRKGMETLEKSKHSISPHDVIVVQNAANPHAMLEEFEKVARAARQYGAAAVGHPVADTLKEIRESLPPRAKSIKRIIKTVSRENLWHMQTPQAFQYELYKKARARGFFKKEYTDEMGWIEALGIQPLVIEAHPANRKITTAYDLPTRTGIGLDSHRFEKPLSAGRSHAPAPLSLGGLRLPQHPKLQANSDGDVMLHALANALRSALGQSSFSAVADPLCRRGIKDSRIYLKKILADVKAQNFTLVHAGFQLHGKTPRIEPLVPRLKSSISKLLKLSIENIGITCTSGEDLTPFGRGEGLECWVVVTLSGKSSLLSL